MASTQTAAFREENLRDLFAKNPANLNDREVLIIGPANDPKVTELQVGLEFWGANVTRGDSIEIIDSFTDLKNAVCVICFTKASLEKDSKYESKLGTFISRVSNAYNVGEISIIPVVFPGAQPKESIKDLPRIEMSRPQESAKRLGELLLELAPTYEQVQSRRFALANEAIRFKRLDGQSYWGNANVSISTLVKALAPKNKSLVEEIIAETKASDDSESISRKADLISRLHTEIKIPGVEIKFAGNRLLIRAFEVADLGISITQVSDDLFQVSASCESLSWIKMESRHINVERHLKEAASLFEKLRDTLLENFDSTTKELITILSKALETTNERIMANKESPTH